MKNLEKLKTQIAKNCGGSEEYLYQHMKMLDELTRFAWYSESVGTMLREVRYETQEQVLHIAFEWSTHSPVWKVRLEAIGPNESYISTHYTVSNDPEVILLALSRLPL